MIEVKITGSQQTVLFEEMLAGRDKGALRFALRGEGRLVADEATMGLIAWRLERSQQAAAALAGPTHKRRAQALARILGRIVKAGVVPVAPEVVVSEATRKQLTSEVVPVLAPESQFLGAKPARPAHHAKLNRVWFDVEHLPSGSAEGRQATKKAWGRNAKPRAGKQAGMVRGDVMFHRGVPDERSLEEDMEIAELMGLPVLTRANTERTVWLRAGEGSHEKRAGRAKLKAGRQAAVEQRQAQETAARVERVIAKLERRGRQVTSEVGVRPARVAAVLLNEDVKAGKFAPKSAPFKACRRRYQRMAREALAGRGREAIGIAGKDAGALDPNRSAPRVVRPVHEHEWKVSPQRQRRSCVGCGRVDRKVRGRWVEIARKVAAPVNKAGTPVDDPRRAERVAARVAVKRAERLARKAALAEQAGAAGRRGPEVR